MHIFLAILKITGLIILIALAVILILLILVLVVPIKYKVSAEFNNDVKASMRITWLAGVLYYKKSYPDTGNDRIRIFGIPVGGRKKASVKKAKSKKNSIKQNTNIKNTNNKKSDTTKNDINLKKVKKTDAVLKESDKSEKTKIAYEAGKTKKNKFGFVKNIKKLSKISDIIEAVRDEDNKRVFSFLKTMLVKVLKHIRPKRIKANLIIGLENPADTGILFGVLGIARGFLKGEYSIYPDFEDKRIEGKLKAKGHVMLVVLLHYMIKIYNNQDFKSVLKKGRAK